MDFQNQINMENDSVELGVGIGTIASHAGTWETLIDLGADVGSYTVVEPAIRAVANTKAPWASECPATSYGTIIGIVFAGGEKARLVSVAEFCVLLDNRELSYMDEDYFDATIITELTKFTFDPFAGTAIDWNLVEQLVMSRSNIVTKRYI